MFAEGFCSQTELIQRCNFSSHHLIDARMASTKSLLHDDNATTPSSSPATTNETNTADSINIRERSYPAMLKLISGSLVGDSKYAEIYAQLELDEQEQPTAQQSSSSDSETSEPTIPTLQDIARKVAKIEGKELDERQYTTYEIICCTFLIGLINTGSRRVFERLTFASMVRELIPTRCENVTAYSPLGCQIRIWGMNGKV